MIILYVSPPPPPPREQDYPLCITVTELDTLVKQWIRSEGLRKRITWSQLEQVGGKVISYGSFKISVVD